MYSSGTRTATATAAADGERIRGDAAGVVGDNVNAADEMPRGVKEEGEVGSVARGGGGAGNTEGQRREEYDPI